LRIIERLTSVTVASTKIQKSNLAPKGEVAMSDIQFFHSILIGLVAATLVSGSMMVVMAMTYGVHLAGFL
jgi:hypothetical protein